MEFWSQLQVIEIKEGLHLIILSHQDNLTLHNRTSSHNYILSDGANSRAHKSNYY